MKTVVIGSGSWGTGLGQVLCDNGREVIIYGNCKEQIDDIEQNHRNAMFFEDVQLNPDLHATMDVNVVKDADVVVLSVPTIAIESVCRQIDPLLKGKVIIVNTSKGFHPEAQEWKARRRPRPYISAICKAFSFCQVAETHSQADVSRPNHNISHEYIDSRIPLTKAKPDRHRSLLATPFEA